jgi:uncharacterized repeat protein (TIGR02059 family)
MPFDETLSAPTPAANLFTVTVNGQSVTPSSVTLNQSSIVLTLASPIGTGQTVRVSYEAPVNDPSLGDNAIQDANGLNALSFANIVVTNGSTVDRTPPTVTTAVAQSTGTSVVLTFNENLAIPTAPVNSFTVTVDGVSVTITSATRGTNTVTLALPVAIQGGQIVRVSYVAPQTDSLATNNAIQDSAGNDALSFSNIAVTNSSTQGRPVLTSVAIGTAGNSVTLTWNKAANTPAFSQFTWRVNGEAIPLTWSGGSNSSGTLVIYATTQPTLTSRDVVT